MVVATIDGAIELEFSRSIRRELDCLGRVRFDLLLDIEFTDRESMTDIDRGDNELDGLALADGDRLRLELKLPGCDLDLNRRGRSIMVLTMSRGERP